MTPARFARPVLNICTLLVLALGLGTSSAVLAQVASPVSSPSGSPVSSPSASSIATACDTEAAIASASTSYAIVSQDSTARYISEEQVSGIGAQTAIGETQAIIGTILFDDANVPLACSRFDADLRTLQSDEARRDNYLYTNTLETETYPLATFVLARVEGLEGGMVDGEATTLSLVGDLTLHGVSLPAVWEAEVTLDGDTLIGTARTSFNMADYNMEQPVVGPVISVDETVELEVEITARVNG